MEKSTAMRRAWKERDKKLPFACLFESCAARAASTRRTRDRPPNARSHYDGPALRSRDTLQCTVPKLNSGGSYYQSCNLAIIAVAPAALESAGRRSKPDTRYTVLRGAISSQVSRCCALRTPCCCPLPIPVPHRRPPHYAHCLVDSRRARARLERLLEFRRTVAAPLRARRLPRWFIRAWATSGRDRNESGVA
eukprot:IDg2025t1